MAYASSSVPVYQAKTAFDCLFPEGRVPDERGYEDLVAQAGVAEYLFQPVLF